MRAIAVSIWISAVLIGLLVESAFARTGSPVHELPTAARATIAAAVSRHDPTYRADAAGRQRVMLHNPAQDIAVSVGEGDVTLAHAGVRWQMSLQRWGRAPLLVSIPHGVLTASDNRAAIARPSITEWYVNTPLGIEQGFTLPQPPHGSDVAGGPVILELESQGPVRLAGTDHGRGLAVTGLDGTLVFEYGELAAFDAAGRDLPISLDVADGRLRIAVDDRGARYPIVVDPLVQTARFRASKWHDGMQFGDAVAVSGDTIVVGAPQDVLSSSSDRSGSVHVFVRSGASWSNLELAAVLRAPVPNAYEFGAAVAIDDDTIVVGAPGGGGAWVFVKPMGGWVDVSPVANLTNSDLGLPIPGSNIRLGESVAIDGDAIIAGAPVLAGAVYVYVKPPGGWTSTVETARLTAAVPVPEEGLGYSVAMDDDAIVAGVVESNTSPGAVYVFEKPPGGWTSASETARLVASDGQNHDSLGNSVAIAGDTIVAGARRRAFGGIESYGAAYVWVRPFSGWVSATETATLVPLGLPSSIAAYAGSAVAVAGDRIFVGSSGPGEFAQGAVHVFDELPGGWSGATETMRIDPSDAQYVGLFGSAIAIGTAGEIVVGTPRTPSRGHPNVGTAYVYEDRELPAICPETPASGCAVAGKGKLSLQYSYSDPEKTKLKWRLAAGPEFHQATLGDPMVSTAFAFCIYGDGALAVAKHLEPGAAYWQAAPEGYRYLKQAKAYPLDGIQKASLVGGSTGKSKISVSGKGADIGSVPNMLKTGDTMMALDAATLVQVQLIQSDGGCYETPFTPSQTRKNLLGYPGQQPRSSFAASY